MTISDYAQIRKLVDRIELNLSEDVNVLDLSDSFGMSPWHFQRSFKSIVGDTLGGYIRGRRLSKAAYLLLNTDKSIIDIAFSVGFNSHEAFTRSFKSVFQLSPKSFRKNRPSVLLKEKPLLTEALYEHLAKGMVQTPVITHLPQRNLVGIQTSVPSPFISSENYCELLHPAWTTLLKRQKEISHCIEGQYYGLLVSPSGQFLEDALIYIAGAGTQEAIEPATGMVSFSFPEQLVAMFEIFAGTEDSFEKTVDYIYGYWFPNSKYTRGCGNDYELFENVVTFEDPGLRSKYVVPLEIK